ncbi:MAG: hypothetical protein COB36_10770 [Alphaproteobacteria bacterium]|nr:MAG: hypothetical protein COB36_10770 [Alphaproteobacteria bacterium]
METSLSVKIDGRRAVSQANKINSSLGKMEKSGNRAAKSTVNLQRKLGLLTGTLAGVVAALGVRQLVQYADTWTEVGTRLRLVTDSTAELTEVQEKLFAVSQDTRSNFEANAILYSRMALATEALGISQSDLIKVTKTLNQQILLGGSNAAEAKAGLIQLSQGLAANRLQGDELRSVMENLLGVSGGLIEGFKKLREKGQIDFDVTRENIRDLAADGVLSADLLLKALLEVADSTDQAFGKVALTVGQSVAVLDNSIGRLIGLSDSVGGLSGSLASSIQSFSQTIDKFTTEEIEEGLDSIAIAAKLAAVVIAGRLGGALLGSVFQIAAMGLASTKTAIQMNAMGTVIGRTTLATRAATVSVAGLSGAMAFLGGPVGLIITAAAALALFAFQADEAVEPSKLLALSADDLTESLSKLSEAKLKLNIQTLEGDVATLRGARDELNELVNAGRKFGKKGGFTGEFHISLTSEEAIREVVALEDAETDLAKAEKTLLEVREKLKNFGKSPAAGIKPETIKAASKAFTTLQTQIKQQIFLLGKTGLASKVLYESAVKVISKKLLPAEAKQLIALAKEFDAKNDLISKNKELATQEKDRADALIEKQQEILSEADGIVENLQRQLALYGTTGSAAGVAYDNAKVSLEGLTEAQKASAKASQATALGLAKQLDSAQGKESLKALEDELRTQEESLVASQKRRVEIIIHNTAEGSQKRADLLLKAEQKLAEDLNGLDPFSQFAEQAASNIQDTFAEFLFDPFANGLEGMVDGFLKANQRMVAEVASAQLLGPDGLNLEGVIKSGFGSGAKDKAASITADAVEGTAESALLTASATALTGSATALTGSATAVTTASTASSTAITTASTTSVTAISTAATTSAATIVGSITSASASLVAAATALSAAAAAMTAGSASSGASGLLGASSLFGGGKASGGNVFPNRMNEVGEFNKPELLTQGGRSYLIPGNKGKVQPVGQSGSNTTNNIYFTAGPDKRENSRAIGQIKRELAGGVSKAARYT